MVNNSPPEIIAPHCKDRALMKPSACCPSTLLAFYEITRALEKIMQIFCTLLPLFVLTVRASRVRPRKVCLCRIIYPSFILVLSWFYPGFILILSR